MSWYAKFVGHKMDVWSATREVLEGARRHTSDKIINEVESAIYGMLEALDTILPRDPGLGIEVETQGAPSSAVAGNIEIAIRVVNLRIDTRARGTSSTD